MVFAIITAWLAYKRATANGRNGILWGAIGIGVFIGTQLLVGLGVGMFLAFGVALLNWPESVFDDYTLPINIVAVVAAFFASWLLLRFLDHPPKEEVRFAVSPSPSDMRGQAASIQNRTGSAIDNEE